MIIFNYYIILIIFYLTKLIKINFSILLLCENLTVEIDYMNRSGWRNYFINNVLSLYESSLAVLNIWNELVKTCNDRLLSDMIKENSSLELIFAGGTTPPDKYEERSLARIYNELLGTKINLREYHFLRSLGKEPSIICTVRQTIIIKYLEQIAMLLERTLKHACELKLISFNELQRAKKIAKDITLKTLRSPENIVKILFNFVNKAYNFTVISNEYTRFIWYMRKIPKKYMQQFYPRLLRKENFNFIQELLGLREFIKPEVEDEEIAELYTIYSFDHAIHIEHTTTSKGEPRIKSFDYHVIGYFNPYQITRYIAGYITVGIGLKKFLEPPYITIGGCLCRVNELIWGLFEDGKEKFSLFLTEIPNPKSDWINAVEKHFPMVDVKLDGAIKFLGYPDSYEKLSILDEYLPAILVGKLELLKDDKDQIILLMRW